MPPLVDWVNDMIDDDPSWTSVEASPFNVLFPGACSGASDNPGERCHLDEQCPNGECQGHDPWPDPLIIPSRCRIGPTLCDRELHAVVS